MGLKRINKYPVNHQLPEVCRPDDHNSRLHPIGLESMSPMLHNLVESLNIYTNFELQSSLC